MVHRVNSLARRYARAVIGAAADASGQSGALRVAGEALAVAELTRGHEDLRLVLHTPLFSVGQRRQVIGDLTTKLGASPITARLLWLLCEHGRMVHLRAIASAIRVLLLEAANVVPLEVVAASPLQQPERQGLEKKFQALLGKSVEAHYSVDPSLLGGVLVTANGRSYDGSLLGKLEALREQLIGGA